MIDTTFLHNTVSAQEGMTAYDTGAMRRAKVQPGRLNLGAPSNS
jgi:hypothetical protein